MIAQVRRLFPDLATFLVFTVAFVVLVSAWVVGVPIWLVLVGIIGVGVWWLLIRRPALGAIGLIAFAFVNPSLLPTVFRFGEFDVRAIDIMFLAVIIVLVMRGLTIGRLQEIQSFAYVTSPFVPFLLWIGLSLFWVDFYVGEHFFASLASYTRLIMTTIVGGVIYMSIVSVKDWHIWKRGLLVLAGISVLIGIWDVFHSEKGVTFASRYGGILGLNSYGQISGLLVLYGWILRSSRKEPSLLWLIPFGLGIFGLVLSKSTSSVFATVTSFVMSAYLLKRKESSSIKSLKLFRIILTGFVLAFGLTYLLRYQDWVGLFRLEGGSFAQRLMLGYAGLRIFYESPFWGVGWQASGTEALISDPNLNQTLKEVFRSLPSHYFPSENPTSVHNMYVQILAELGIIGFFLFLYSVYKIAMRCGMILRNISLDSPYFVWSRFSALGLIYLLIWWNTNPLYGGQTESLLAFGFLSTLATVWRLEQKRGIIGNEHFDESSSPYQHSLRRRG